MEDFVVRPITVSQAKPFIEANHYSRKCPTGRNIFFGAFIGDELYAVADYGAGSNMDKGAALARQTGLPVRYQDVTTEWLAAPHDHMSVEGLEPGPLNCVELKRLCRIGAKGESKIHLTRFLAVCHRILKNGRPDEKKPPYGIRYVVSYSDPGELRAVPVDGEPTSPYHSQDGRWQIQPPDPVPHPVTGVLKQQTGHIYRAANFQHLGFTEPQHHTVDAKGTVVHRRTAYKEMLRRRAAGKNVTLADVRKERGLVPIKTPPKERWFIALFPDDAKKLAERLRARPDSEA